MVFAFHARKYGLLILFKDREYKFWFLEGKLLRRNFEVVSSYRITQKIECNDILQTLAIIIAFNMLVIKTKIKHDNELQMVSLDDSPRPF